MKNRRFLLVLLAVGISLTSGCATLDKANRYDKLSREFSALKRKMEKLNAEKDAEIERLKRERDEESERLKKEKQLAVNVVEETKAKELSDLEKAKLELEKRLQDEIEAYKAKLQITERGLVVTFLSEIFFDSGKDKIKPEGEATLKKV